MILKHFCYIYLWFFDVFEFSLGVHCSAVHCVMLEFTSSCPIGSRTQFRAGMGVLTISQYACTPMNVASWLFIFFFLYFFLADFPIRSSF
jgi:hypothetical protein